MSEEISKGMVALRRSRTNAERIVIGNETFYFRRLTIDDEAKIDEIVARYQEK